MINNLLPRNNKIFTYSHKNKYDHTKRGISMKVIVYMFMVTLIVAIIGTSFIQAVF